MSFISKYCVSLFNNLILKEIKYSNKKKIKMHYKKFKKKQDKYFIILISFNDTLYLMTLR